MEQYELNTKKRFTIEALKLFAEKGYEAVSVSEIAKAVGCSAPALYKHYKSKQDLLDAIIDESEIGFARQMENMKFDICTDDETRDRVINMTEEEEIERVKDIVRYAIHNEISQAFRKFCVVEQYHMQRLAEIYNYRYTTFPINQYEEVISLWIKNGKLKPGDPKAMATLYISYPIMAIGICDREPDREKECLLRIEEHIKEFNAKFRR